MLNFKNINIVLENQIKSGSLLVENGKIKSINKSDDINGLDLSDYYLVPGFIDQHIHGAAGYDFMDASKEALEGISKALLKEGTTSFLGTTMTQSPENVINSVYNLKPQVTSGANLLGVHLEGPFINHVFKGAQPGEYIIPPSINLFEQFNKYNNIKLVSMAMENDHNNEFVKYLVNKNIVATQAHTNATYLESSNAIKAGAKGFTHAYNAMSKLHHRDIGVVGAMLLHDEAYAECIVDGIHVSPEAVKLLYKNKTREKMILITDSMRAKYLPDGMSELGGQEVIVKNNEARLIDGTLAGSILKMNDAVKNVIKYTGCSLVDAVYMATKTPATYLGLESKGMIKEGYDADLCVLDKDLNVVMTIVEGKVLFER